MRSKRGREDLPSSVDVSSSSADDHILREAAHLASVGDVQEENRDGLVDGSKRRHAEEDQDILDRFSLRIVSSLQGSSSLQDAQERAREVLHDFRKDSMAREAELQAKVEKYMAANKVLGRALMIMKDKLISSQSVASEANLRSQEADERVRNLEHTVNVLRWHLQNDRPAGGINTPPDVF